MVCARHLKLFQYNTAVHYPKRTDKPLYKNLTSQCISMNIPLLDKLPEETNVEADYGLIVDALFGFSFKPPVREPFVGIINLMKQSQLPIIR